MIHLVIYNIIIITFFNNKYLKNTIGSNRPNVKSIFISSLNIESYVSLTTFTHSLWLTIYFKIQQIDTGLYVLN